MGIKYHPSKYCQSLGLDECNSKKNFDRSKYLCIYNGSQSGIEVTSCWKLFGEYPTNFNTAGWFIPALMLTSCERQIQLLWIDVSYSIKNLRNRWWNLHSHRQQYIITQLVKKSKQFIVLINKKIDNHLQDSIKFNDVFILFIYI